MSDVEHVGTMLRDLWQMHKLATHSLVPSAQTNSSENKATKSASAPIGVNLDALELSAGYDMLARLEDWERDIRRWYGFGAYGAVSARRAQSTQGGTEVDRLLQGCLAWLGGVLGALERDEYPRLGEFVRDVRNMHARALDAIRQDRGQRVANPNASAPCLTADCKGAIRFLRSLTCPVCRTSFRRQELIDSASLQGVMVPPRVASWWLGVSDRDLRRMHERGHIRRAQGAYDLGSVIVP